jgi:hypothetical protein
VTTPPSRDPDPLDTAEYTFEEIQQRLELGRLIVEATENGSRLVMSHADMPIQDRRHHATPTPQDVERRTFRPLNLPTLFPEKGPILILLVGGFAVDSSLRCPMPFWEDDAAGGYLVWQALSRAGLLHKKDKDLALGRGGFWDDAPPRTLGLAMTYVGLRPQHGGVDFEHVVHSWNIHRLETLTEACLARSMDRLKVVTLGEAARFMMCAIAYGMPGIPVLSLPEPTEDQLARNMGNDSAAGLWLDWASDLLAVGRSSGADSAP